MSNRYTTSTGMDVFVTPMLAYPDGMLLAAELTALALPAIGALPPGSLDMIKTAMLAEGSTEQAVKLALMSVIGPDPATGAASASALFDGLSRTLFAITDRARFRRITGDLLRTLTVQLDAKMVELVDEQKVQAVTGTNLRLVAELLGIAFRGNIASFTSGAGGTSDASATGAPAVPASR
jgi:hypothetical protein